jgi:prevent-host-death family protein
MYDTYKLYNLEDPMPNTRGTARGPRRPRRTRKTSPEPDLDSVAASLVRESFAEYVSRVAFTGRRVVVKHHGRPRVAIVSMEDLQLLRALEDRIDLKAALRALRGRRTTAWSKVKADLGL